MKKNKENKISPESNFTICGVLNSHLKLFWLRYHKIYVFLIFHLFKFLPKCQSCEKSFFTHGELRKHSLKNHKKMPWKNIFDVKVSRLLNKGGNINIIASSLNFPCIVCFIVEQLECIVWAACDALTLKVKTVLHYNL